MPIRLLGDAVLRRRAWDLADRLGSAETYDAEYVALTQLQADALVTLDGELARRVEGVVTTASIDALRTASVFPGPSVPSWCVARGACALSRFTSRIVDAHARCALTLLPRRSWCSRTSQETSPGLEVRAVAHTPTRGRPPTTTSGSRFRPRSRPSTRRSSVHADSQVSGLPALDRFPPGLAVRPTAPETVNEHLLLYGPQRRPFFVRLAV